MKPTTLNERAETGSVGLSFIKKAEEPLYLYLISRVFPPVHSLNALTHLFHETQQIFAIHVQNGLPLPQDFISLMVVLLFVVSGRRSSYDVIYDLVTMKNKTVGNITKLLAQEVDFNTLNESNEMSDSEQFATGFIMSITIPLISELLNEINCEKIVGMLKKWKTSLLSHVSYLTPPQILRSAPTEFSYHVFSQSVITFVEKEFEHVASMNKLYTFIKETRTDVIESTLKIIFENASIPIVVDEVQPQVNIPTTTKIIVNDVSPISSFCCSPDNECIIYSTKDGVKRFLKKVTEPLHKQRSYGYYAINTSNKMAVKVTQYTANCIDPNPKYPYFVVGTEDGAVLVFKYSQDEAIQQTTLHSNVTLSINGNGMKGVGVKAIRWNSAGTKFIVIDAQGYVVVYRFIVNKITQIYSERLFEKGVDAFFIGESMYFVAAGNVGSKGSVVIGNILNSEAVCTKTFLENVNAICLAERYNLLIVAENEYIKYIDLKTGRVCNEKQLEKGIRCITVDMYCTVMFAGLSDGRIVMSHLPDLSKYEEIGRHHSKPKTTNLFKTIVSSTYFTVNKLCLVCDGSLIQHSLIYYQ
ncbi:hypothetical protein QTN25_008296 [Entamoeba marina]